MKRKNLKTLIMSYPKDTLIEPFRVSFSQKHLWCFLVTYDYDNMGQVKREVHTSLKPNNTTLRTTTEYAYNNEGYLVELRETTASNQDRMKINYEYDTADKLTQTITTTKGVSVTNNYTHDTAGNIINDGIYTYSYDVGNRVILKQGNGERILYDYDLDGNLVSERTNTGIKTYSYNSQNKLVRGQAENGDISAYIYNALGVRVITEQLQDNINAVYQNAVFNNGSRFMTDYMPVLIDTRNVWQRSYETEVGSVVQNDPEFIRKEYITDYTSIANRDIIVYEEGSYIQRYVYGLNGERTSAEFSYYPETERTADLSNPGENPASDFAAVDIQKIYYFRNLLDSTMLAMDRNGDVISHVMYDEWGTPLTEPRLDHNFSGIKNINNYTGYTYDYILEIYFAQNLFYNPDTRQFTQQDPIKDGMNFYQYVGGNPLVYVDPWGLDAVWLTDSSGAKGLGHSAIMIEDKDGTWYLINFGNPDVKGAPMFVVEKVDFNQYNFYPKNHTFEFVNASYDYEKYGMLFQAMKTFHSSKGSEAWQRNLNRYFDEKGDLVLYIKGDFSSSLNFACDEAKTDVKYWLTTTNCVWKSVEILQKSYPKGSDMYRQLEDILYDKDYIYSAIGAKPIEKTIIPNLLDSKIYNVFESQVTYKRGI